MNPVDFVTQNTQQYFGPDKSPKAVKPIVFDLEEADFLEPHCGPNRREVISVRRPTPYQGNVEHLRLTMNDHQLRLFMAALLEYFTGETVVSGEEIRFTLEVD